ncbi:MAG: hypothetical protein ACR2O2_17145 [Ruegeria sp.]
MKIIGYMFKIVIGLGLGLLTSLVMIPAFATFHSEGESTSSYAMIIVTLAVAALCVFAPTIRRAIGRGFLSLGVAFFILPISAMLLTGRVATETMEETNDAATAVGAAIGGGLMTGMSTVVGFFMGTVFVVLSLVMLLGGRKEVVVVEKKTT